LGAENRARGRNRQNSLLISLLAGNLSLETGSIWSASTTMLAFGSFVLNDRSLAVDKPLILLC